MTGSNRARAYVRRYGTRYVLGGAGDDAWLPAGVFMTKVRDDAGNPSSAAADFSLFDCLCAVHMSR